MFHRVVLLAAVCLAVNAAPVSALYDQDTAVEKLNHLNFATFIKKADSMNHVKLINFYTEKNCPNCKSMEKEYNELAKQLRGVVKVTAVDCDAQKKICDEYKVTTFPTIKVIPPGGFGTQDYDGERTAKAMYSWAVRFISHFVEKVTAENLDAFLNKNAGKYKALLFTDKAKTPLLWRGLSIDFKGKMTLGIVNKDEKGVVGRYKVSKFPTVLVVKPGEKKPIKFIDKFNYDDLFEFINRYQETFAMENLAADEEQLLKKPWLTEALPEMTSLSAADICYNGDAVCVIAVVQPGADGKLAKAHADVLMSAKAKYSSGNAKFSFMWMNANRDAAAAAAFGIENPPAVIAFRTGKRTRFARAESDFTAEGLGAFLDRVLGGDVQYKPLKEGPPKLEAVPPPEVKK